jgi:hypothetical protein
LKEVCPGLLAIVFATVEANLLLSPSTKLSKENAALRLESILIFLIPGTSLLSQYNFLMKPTVVKGSCLQYILCKNRLARAK